MQPCRMRPGSLLQWTADSNEMVCVGEEGVSTLRLRLREQVSAVDQPEPPLEHAGQEKPSAPAQSRYSERSRLQSNMSLSCAVGRACDVQMSP
jgi:hypothetical protein